jgi:prevent-host-death family protein
MILDCISMTELRIQARDILEGARFRGERYVVHRYGRPMAVIIGIEEYRRWMTRQGCETAAGRSSVSDPSPSC